MADGRRNNKVTKGNKGGRAPKADEQMLVERLSPLDDAAFEVHKKAIKAGEKWAIELYYKYRFGMPKQLIGVVTEEETIDQIFKIGGTEIKL